MEVLVMVRRGGVDALDGRVMGLVKPGAAVDGVGRLVDWQGMTVIHWYSPTLKDEHGSTLMWNSTQFGCLII